MLPTKFDKHYLVKTLHKDHPCLSWVKDEHPLDDLHSSLFGLWLGLSMLIWFGLDGLGMPVEKKPDHLVDG